MTATLVVYGADPTGAVDSAAATQAAINACKATGGGTVYLPRGNYKITTPLNMADLGSTMVALVGDGHSEGFYNTIPLTGTSLYGCTGTQAVIETQGSHYVTLRDFSIYSMLADANRSAVGIFISRTTFQASAEYHSYTRCSSRSRTRQARTPVVARLRCIT
jgi:hypothetical protein